MAAISTAYVGANAQPLLGAPAAGQAPASVTVINLDTENTVNLGSAASQLQFPLGPLASLTMTAPVWAAAATEPLQVGLVPGGSGYSPGSLTITGPVTAEITGPVTVEGTIDIGNSPTVDLAAGATVDISGIADVNVQNATLDIIGSGGFVTGGEVGNLFQSANTTIGPGAINVISPSINVENYTSIVLSMANLTNTSAAAGAAVCAIFHVTWFDSLGDETATDTLSTLLGANVAPTWEIPARGSTCTLSIQNVGTVGSINVSAGFLVIDGSYRAIPNVRVTQGFIGAPLPTLTGCTAVLQGNPVFQVASWIASLQYAWSGANANVVIPLPQWAGEVTGFYEVITTALARAATIVDLTYAVQGGFSSGLGTGYPYGIINAFPAAITANPVQTTFNLPPTQCAVIIDTPAAAGQFFLSLVGVGN